MTPASDDDLSSEDGPTLEHVSAAEHRSLIREATRGDASAIEQLLVEHLPQLEAFVRRRRDRLPAIRESATNVVQSACREVLENLGRLENRGPEAFRSWLFKVAFTKIVHKHRQHHRVCRDINREVRPTTFGDVYATFSTPSQAAIANEEYERLRDAFDALPEHYREVVYLRRVLGLPRIRRTSCLSPRAWAGARS